jgi:iron complex outermembrane recepter protein
MKYIFILALFIFPQSVYQAQVILVKDITTNEPLELVTITSHSPKAITVSNAAGEAKIALFKNSPKITFQLLGYSTIIISYDEIKENNFSVVLTPKNISIDQVVVSATKWGQSKNEISSKVTVISPKEIEFQNPQTAADLLNISGEVFIQKSQQGGGSPMLRGFATNRILISVDGIRMNNAIFRSGNIQNVISLDPFTIENTEVLFGPGSIIYGSDAIGGSMNFYTKRPQFTLSDAPLIYGNAQYRFSSANNENTGHIDLNLGWKKFAMITSVSYNSFCNLTMGSNGPDEYLRNEYVKSNNGSDQTIENKNPENQISTKYSQLNLMQKLRFSPNGNWYFDYGYNLSTTTDFDRYDRMIRYKKDSLKSAEWYYGPQKWILNNLTITNLSPNQFYDDLAIRLAYQHFEESRNDRDYQDTELRIREEQVDAYSLNIDLNKELNSTSRLIYGVEAVINTVNSIGINENIVTGIKEDGPSRYPKSNWLSLAGYLVYQNNLRSDLHFQAGFRYNYYELKSDYDTTFYPFPFTTSNISDGAVNGSLGLIFTPTESWSIGLNLSTGFRSPNVDDIGKVFDSEPGSVVVPNPNLKAEFAYNTEINVAKIFDDFLKLDLTGYYTFLENAMVRRDFELNGFDSIYYNNELSQVQAIQNGASAYVWGIQAGFDLNIMDNLSLTSRISFQIGEEELDNGENSPLRHAAPMFGTTHLVYKHINIKADLYLNYNGEISYNNLSEEERSKTYIYATDNNGNPYSPSWYSLNFKISYDYSKQLSLKFGIENITDERYRPYSSGIAAPGRNFILSTKVHF